ncbi:MAG TPA: SCE4755 family polysaccharide monooxygenase-like protein [Bryobacteraceae bacterium]|jgi:hypothetical protein
MKPLAHLWLIPPALLALAPFAGAHFRLLEPQSWIVENQLGDPQKLGPCGGTSADAGTPTNMISKVTGGQKLHVKVQETVYHPGHYRIALAVNSRAELPPDPATISRDSAKGPMSVSATIQNPPRIPVLADGLFVHTARTTDPFETDVQIPNISCPKCTLQIVEFMAEHGVNKDGGYFYHHCADIQITADPAKPVDAGWPAAKK